MQDKLVFVRNRVYVHEAVEAEFVQQLTQKVHELKVGNGMDEDVTIDH